MISTANNAFSIPWAIKGPIGISDTRIFIDSADWLRFVPIFPTTNLLVVVEEDEVSTFEIKTVIKREYMVIRSMNYTDQNNPYVIRAFAPCLVSDYDTIPRQEPQEFSVNARISAVIAGPNIEDFKEALALKLARNGTRTGMPTNSILLIGGAGSETHISPSSEGYILTSNGVSASPSFQQILVSSYPQQIYRRDGVQLQATVPTIITHSLGLSSGNILAGKYKIVIRTNIGGTIYMLGQNYGSNLLWGNPSGVGPVSLDIDYYSGGYPSASGGYPGVMFIGENSMAISNGPTNFVGDIILYKIW